MDGQSTEDKLSVLNTIFGNDLTQSVITNTLVENNNQFDPTVEKLLTIPANKVNPPQPQPQALAPIDNNAKENIQRLHTMFGDLTQSVITTVYESNKRDVEGTVDTLLNMTSNEVATGARREAEIARQEQELRYYDEFKQVQQRLQEQERIATEAAQQRAREEEQRQKAAAEALRRVEQDKKMQEEHQKALQEQERLLLEFQRKKAADEQEKERKAAEEREKAAKKAAEERKVAEAAEKKRAEELAKRSAEEKKKAEELKKREELIRQKAEEQRRAEEARLAAEQKLKDERRAAEERLALKKLEEENLRLQKQKQMAEAERKLIEARMKEEIQREEEERKRFAENERRLREEQENIKRSWEEKLRKLENERRLEEQTRKEEELKRAEAKRAEEEERARHEADMRKILELERLKLEEQRRRVEEEKRNAEERLQAMELAAKKREEEEAERARLEEEKRREEEERRREEEEQIRLLEEERQMREQIKEEMTKVQAQEQFAASAIMVPPAAGEPKVQILAEVDGTAIRGTWKLLEGSFPTPQAWLGLFAKRSINTYVGFLYVNGTSGEFHFKNLTPGHYEVRIFGNKLVTSRLAESETLLVGPKVVSFSAQMQGDHIMFEYKLDPPSVPSSWDWVGIYEKDQRRNKNYLSSTYGSTSGTITATLPRTPGSYQARLFAAGSKYNEQDCVEFTVVDNDHISAELVDGAIKASWVMRTVEPTSSDWIGVFATGESSEKKYLASVYTHGATAGNIDIPLPKDISAGLYELRLFSSKVGKYATFKVSNVVTIN